MKKMLLGTTLAAMAAFGIPQGAGKANFQDFSWNTKYNAFVELTSANGSKHTGGALFLMGEGSVRSVRTGASLQPTGKVVTIKFVQTGMESGRPDGPSMFRTAKSEHRFPKIKVTLVTVEKDGRMKATRVFEFKDVKTKSVLSRQNEGMISMILKSFSEDNSSQATYYVGTANGGVWKTTNG